MSLRMSAVMAAFAGFPAVIMRLWFSAGFRIEAGLDERRHVQRLAQLCAPAADEGVSLRSAG